MDETKDSTRFARSSSPVDLLYSARVVKLVLFIIEEIEGRERLIVPLNKMWDLKVVNALLPLLHRRSRRSRFQEKVFKSQRILKDLPFCVNYKRRSVILNSLRAELVNT